MRRSEEDKDEHRQGGGRGVMKTRRERGGEE
jgi:hypothetical protein